MDGPVIQEASGRALEAGTTPADAFALVRAARDAGLSVPVAFMTYLNPDPGRGHRAFLDGAVDCGASGVIVPDLPVDEAGDWVAACGGPRRRAGVARGAELDPRAAGAIAAASRGFVYCVSTFGVTGSRQELSGSAEAVVAALRPLTETPLLVGVGISTPDAGRSGVRVRGRRGRRLRARRADADGGPRRRRWLARWRSERRSAGSGVANARIEVRVHDVDDQVHERDEERRDEVTSRMA